MTLEEYIELFEKPSFKVEVDTVELLGLFKELKELRETLQGCNMREALALIGEEGAKNE